MPDATAYILACSLALNMSLNLINQSARPNEMVLESCWNGAGQTQGTPNLQFAYSASPFGFAITRIGDNQTFPLFNTAGNRIVFKVHVLQPLSF